MSCWFISLPGILSIIRIIVLEALIFVVIVVTNFFVAGIVLSSLNCVVFALHVLLDMVVVTPIVLGHMWVRAATSQVTNRTHMSTNPIGNTILDPYLRGSRRPSVFIISVKNSFLALIFQILEYPTKIDNQIFEHLVIINMLVWVIKYGQLTFFRRNQYWLFWGPMRFKVRFS